MLPFIDIDIVLIVIVWNLYRYVHQLSTVLALVLQTWPDIKEVPGFQQTTMNFHNKCFKLGLRVLKTMAIGLKQQVNAYLVFLYCCKCLYYVAVFTYLLITGTLSSRTRIASEQLTIFSVDPQPSAASITLQWVKTGVRKILS